MIKVAVVCGGQSGEHEVSLRSATSVMKNLDRGRFSVQGIWIDKKGVWRRMPELSSWLSSQGETFTPDLTWPEVPLKPFPEKSTEVDVYFPVLHGTRGEDGTIQGLFELMDKPYVGCGVLASAVGMDKEVTKRLASASGLPTVPGIVLRKGHKINASQQKQIDALGLPLFVKPVNAGSSVGVHKVKTAVSLAPALNDAFRYDTKVLIEKAVPAREIEVSVLESATPGSRPRASIAGEIIPTHEFYSYEAKYLDEKGADLKIPALLSEAQQKEVQKMAIAAFEALECEGLARVDFFLDRQKGQFYFNEINTLPGFTSISMYPKLWQASGLEYSALLSELVDLAMTRHTLRTQLVRDFHGK